MADADDKTSPTNSSGPGTLRDEPPATVGGVLGLLAHDLRNPLAALSSNVGFLGMMGEELSQDVQEAIVDLQLSVEALGRIVDSLELVCNDLSAANVPRAMQVRIGDLLRTALPPVERAAQSHGVSLEAQVGVFAEDHILVSEVVFTRALSALLHNAITSAPGRSTVRLTVLREGSDIVFRVEDDGVALSPELAEQALSAAGQVEIKTARGGRYSRGLGLYVVARSAELSGARLRIGEREGGSTMELCCPEAN